MIDQTSHPDLVLTNTRDDRTAYANGYRAGQRAPSVGYLSCPHPEGSPLRASWMAGWRRASSEHHGEPNRSERFSPEGEKENREGGRGMEIDEPHGRNKMMNAPASSLAAAMTFLLLTYGTPANAWYSHEYRYDSGPAIAAGVFGFTLGAIAGAASHPGYAYPPPVYPAYDPYNPWQCPLVQTYTYDGVPAGLIHRCW